MKHIHIQQIPAFEDNYLWLIHDSQNAIIVDPGDAVPVQAYLNHHNLKLCAILITHHHEDHIGGVAELLKQSPTPIPVFGPQSDLARIPTITQGLQDGSSITIEELGLQFQILEVPGHTRSHIAYYCSELASLFCGDTLFAGGCGRLFEGTPEQMLTSLNKIAALPSATRIYCAHEYTLSNLRFAVEVEPGNAQLAERYRQVGLERAQGISTVPSQLITELQTNPFMRSGSPDIIHTLQSQHKLGSETDPVSVFTATREWKNNFK
ncbi:hydroxyacylglutathione hydrolase [Oxalobacteraceae bacterium GrIS 2.11]